MTEPVLPKKPAALFERPKPGFTLAHADYSAWLKRKEREGWRGPAGLFGFGLFVGIITLFGMSADPWLLRFEIAAMATLAIFASGMVHTIIWHRRTVARWTAPGPVTVDINPWRDELVETAGGTERSHRWIEVKEVLRDPAHLFILMRGAPVIIIPKSAFEDEEAAESFVRYIDQRAISAEDAARDAANPNAPD